VTPVPPRDFTYGAPTEVASVPIEIQVDAADTVPFGTGDVEVTAFEPGNCVVSPWGQTVGVAVSAAGAPPLRTRLAVDSSLVLTFVQHTRSGVGRSACPNSVQFRPEAGFEYRAVYRKSEGWCGSAVTRRREGSADEWIRDPTIQQTPLCFDARTRQRLEQDYRR
jgi:hypothetical protein